MRLNRILLIPCLFPLFIVLFIAFMNTEKITKVRILTWQSSRINIAILMSIGSITAATFSGIIASGSAMKFKKLRRTVYINQDDLQYDRKEEPIINYNEKEEIDNKYELSQDYTERDLRDTSPT